MAGIPAQFLNKSVERGNDDFPKVPLIIRKGPPPVLGGSSSAAPSTPLQPRQYRLSPHSSSPSVASTSSTSTLESDIEILSLRSQLQKLHNDQFAAQQEVSRIWLNLDQGLRDNLVLSCCMPALQASTGSLAARFKLHWQQ